MLIYFKYYVLPTKVKFGQILVCCMRNISNLFLAKCWKLETNSRLFYFFIKRTIKQDLTIFNSWHFWLSLIRLFKKMIHWNLDISCYWVTEAGFQIEKNLELSPSPPNCDDTDLVNYGTVENTKTWISWEWK